VVVTSLDSANRLSLDDRLVQTGEQAYWVIENLHSGWFYFSELLILKQWYFKSQHDAAMFRLVWG
jgi:hypothetical protein